MRSISARMKARVERDGLESLAEHEHWNICAVYVHSAAGHPTYWPIG